VQTIDFHWRERLETIMDSLAVNLVVIVLVIIDIANIVVFTIVFPSPDDQPDPVPSFVLSVTVIGSGPLVFAFSNLFTPC
jgi:hypothetical protein